MTKLISNIHLIKRVETQVPSRKWQCKLPFSVKSPTLDGFRMTGFNQPLSSGGSLRNQFMRKHSKPPDVSAAPVCHCRWDQRRAESGPCDGAVPRRRKSTVASSSQVRQGSFAPSPPKAYAAVCAAFPDILNTGGSSWACCCACEIPGKLSPVLIYKNQSKRHFPRQRISLSYIFWMFFAQYIAQRKCRSAMENVRETHKCEQKPYQTVLTPRWQEIHSIILSRKERLQVKMVDTHQAREMVSCLLKKVLLCNLSSLLVSIYRHQ